MGPSHHDSHRPIGTSSYIHTYLTYLLSTYLLACVHACDCARRNPPKNWKSSTDSGTKPNNLFSLLRERHDYSSCRKRKDREPAHLTIEREERRKREIVMSREWRRKWRVSMLYSPYHHNPPKRTLTNIKTCIEAVICWPREFQPGGDAANNTTRQGKPLPTVDRWKPSRKKKL